MKVNFKLSTHSGAYALKITPKIINLLHAFKFNPSTYLSIFTSKKLNQTHIYLPHKYHIYTQTDLFASKFQVYPRHRRKIDTNYVSFTLLN